ncbi:MAG: hypothetical protein JW715_14045 [Sedimentisphaerales bacterium]|nr:hypothetical protein [Sedimentisphaerales bacterium]
MKRYIFGTVAVLVALTLVWSAFGQPAGGGGGFGQGGGQGRGGFGQMQGMRGMGRARQRPSREERLAAIKTLETQIAALKKEIEKAPATDPNVANLEGDARTTFMAQYTEESNAVNAIQQTLATITGRGARGGRSAFGMFGGGADTLSELRVLANKEKATKTVARLDELIQEEQTRANRRGQMGDRQGGQGQRQRGQRNQQQ